MKVHNPPRPRRRTTPWNPLPKIILTLLATALMLTGFGRIKPLLDTLFFAIVIVAVVLLAWRIIGDWIRDYREKENR